MHHTVHEDRAETTARHCCAAMLVAESKVRLPLVLGLTLLAVLAMWSARAARSAVQIGQDEHYEVVKAQLWAQGYSLYDRVWDDQPPLYTALLGVCFRCLGTSIVVARAVAAAFGLLLLTGCWALVGRRFCPLAAFLATVCLVVAPQVFELSVSAMLEVPAFAVALWSLWPIHAWQEKQQWRWLVLSGFLLAAALQIKLTAAVVTPALASEVLMTCHGKIWVDRSKESLRCLGVWSGSVAGAYLGLAALLGHAPLHVLWASHFSAETLARSNSLAFSPGLISENPDAAWAAAAGLLVAVWRREWRRMSFPLVWLFTVILVHMEHRPWWPYYYLHFAIPLALLAGPGITEILLFGWVRTADGLLRPPFVGLAALAVASLHLSLLVAYGGQRLVSDVERIRSLPMVEENALIAMMRKYASATRWVYTRETIYPFHARLLVIPELAMLPTKRFWSGQITEKQIWSLVKEYRPEQVLLADWQVDTGYWQSAQSGYRLVYHDQDQRLYVSRALKGQ